MLDNISQHITNKSAWVTNKQTTRVDFTARILNQLLPQNVCSDWKLLQNHYVSSKILWTPFLPSRNSIFLFYHSQEVFDQPKDSYSHSKFLHHRPWSSTTKISEYFSWEFKSRIITVLSRCCWRCGRKC